MYTCSTKITAALWRLKQEGYKLDFSQNYTVQPNLKKKGKMVK